MLAKMLSNERVQDSSDGDSSTSEPTQTLKQRLERVSTKRSKSNNEEPSQSEDNEFGSDSDNSHNSSKSSVSLSTTASKRDIRAVPKSSTEHPTKRTKLT